MRLDFGNLPLIDARINLVLTGALVAMDMETVFEMKTALNDLLPLVRGSDLQQPQEVGLGHLKISFGAIQPTTLANDEEGLSLQMKPDGLSVCWTRESSDETTKYPRFEKLFEILERADAVLKKKFPQSEYSVVNMVYANFVDVGGDPSVEHLLHYIKGEYIPVSAKGSSVVHELNFSYRVADNSDFRIQIQAAGTIESAGANRGFVLGTSVGKAKPGANWKDALTEVHERLLTLFEAMITDEAKGEWKLAVNA